MITLEQIPGDDPYHRPTLNAFADHDYISWDGLKSFTKAPNAIQIGHRFGYDLSVILSALGLMEAGDLVTGKYTIGGADARVPNTIGPVGGLGKHGVFDIDIDGCTTRQDVHFGNNANLPRHK